MRGGDSLVGGWLRGAGGVSSVWIERRRAVEEEWFGGRGGIELW